MPLLKVAAFPFLFLSCCAPSQVSNAAKKSRADYDRRRRQGADAACDVWAIGCLLFELLFNEMLFQASKLATAVVLLPVSRCFVPHCLTTQLRGVGTKCDCGVLG